MVYPRLWHYVVFNNENIREYILYLHYACFATYNVSAIHSTCVWPAGFPASTTNFLCALTVMALNSEPWLAYDMSTYEWTKRAVTSASWLCNQRHAMLTHTGVLEVERAAWGSSHSQKSESQEHQSQHRRHLWLGSAQSSKGTLASHALFCPMSGIDCSQVQAHALWVYG